MIKFLVNTSVIVSENQIEFELNSGLQKLPKRSIVIAILQQQKLAKLHYHNKLMLKLYGKANPDTERLLTSSQVQNKNTIA